MRQLWTLCLAAVASLWMITAANAVTISGGVLNSGEFEDIDSGNVGINKPLTAVSYDFASGSGFSQIVVTLDKASTRSASFSQLFFELIDNGNVIGTFNAMAGKITQVFSNAAGHNYSIKVSYATNSGGGSNKYLLGVSAVPVPPALLLLVTGLAGAGFLGRRKQAARKVAV